MPLEAVPQSPQILRDIYESIRSMSAERIDAEESMTSAEAARFLRVHKDELLRYVKMGLPHFEMGKGYRYRRQDLIAFREMFKKGADQADRTTEIRSGARSAPDGYRKGAAA